MATRATPAKTPLQAMHWMNVRLNVEAAPLPRFGLRPFRSAPAAHAAAASAGAASTRRARAARGSRGWR